MSQLRIAQFLGHYGNEKGERQWQAAQPVPDVPSVATEHAVGADTEHAIAEQHPSIERPVLKDMHKEMQRSLRSLAPQSTTLSSCGIAH